MKQQSIDNPIEAIITIQNKALISKSLESKKVLGQFFTSSTVSDYMASLITKPKTEVVRILDAGAGTGILTFSTALKCLYMGCKIVHADLYEIDSEITDALEETLIYVQEIFAQKNSVFTYKIFCKDFVLSRPDKNKNSLPYDLSIINPPYFKYSVKDSPYSKATADLYRGDPNIYASFMAIVMSCMKENGQVVTITPRSFTNGLYFKNFRKYMLSQSSLALIHIFKHRNKVFKNNDTAVLQENIICLFVKGKQFKEVNIRSSDCDASIKYSNEEKYPIDLIIDPSNEQKLIRIPESAYEASFLKQAETFETTFEEAGYFISTGRVVEHRTRNFISLDTNLKNSVPLYRPHNITPIKASWTRNHKKDASFAIVEEHHKHTIKNDTYVLLKRFSSKDEKKRLVAAVYLDNFHDCKYIGFGNKLNYIGIANEKLSTVEAYGLAAIFNSSFMDKYFRCISGNTQVNATEIRVMKFPSRKQVIKIGTQVQNLEFIDLNKIDSIVNSTLGIIRII